jgi:hypothetical protein
MVKTVAGLDPLLRRPFSIFEIASRRGNGRRRHHDPEQAHRRRHGLLYDVEAGARLDCLGPLGRRSSRSRPRRSLDGRRRRRPRPVRTLAEALAARGARPTLFYGARRAADLFCRDCSSGSASRSCSPPRTAAAASRGFVTAPLAGARGGARRPTVTSTPAARRR